MSPGTARRDRVEKAKPYAHPGPTIPLLSLWG